MNAQRRLNRSDIDREGIPTGPGVYVWYREDATIHVGSAADADGLRGPILKHLSTGPDLSRSTLRRYVCEHLGIASARSTRRPPTLLSAAEIGEINAWLENSTVAWIECDSNQLAKRLEADLKEEWLPLLTKRP